MLAHIDADAFFAAVLVRKYPHLRGKPLLAMGMGGGCVISASYEAKAKGVKTGMPLQEALRFVPNALHMPSDFHETALASEQIERLLQNECPLIEQMSVDEWYLDLDSLPGGTPHDPTTWARRVREDVLRKVGISVSVGVAPTKLLAKMASEYLKPGGITILSFQPQRTVAGCMFQVQNLKQATYNLQQSDEKRTIETLTIRDFLGKRPAAAIPGIGRKRSIHTEAEGWKTAWDIVEAPTERLLQLFGKQGQEMQLELKGKPVFDVSTDVDPPKSISRCRSFKPSRDREILWAHVLRHLEYTILKMRRWHLGCQGISLWIRNDKYFYESSHLSLPQPLDVEEQLQPYAKRCFDRIYVPSIRCTQIGICLWKLSTRRATQFSLFESPDHTTQMEELQKSLDRLHERYGRNAITHGAAMKVKSGTKMSLDMSVYE